jgi:polysaccharide pyruvyl transferase WcaK-like protein
MLFLSTVPLKALLRRAGSSSCVGNARTQIDESFETVDNRDAISMRILIEPSDYPTLRNLGDIAMQKVAVGRIAEFWPAADIQILSQSPESLRGYAPNVRGISSNGREAWMSGILPPRRVPRAIRHWERRVRERHVRLGERLAKVRLRLQSPQKTTALTTFLETTRTIDVLVVCGMGGVTDTFEEYALDLLDTIELVKMNGKGVVAMFGQAFGPIGDHSALAARAREVLPKIDFIALREARASIPLLERLNVDLSRVRITGDDALEIAAANRCSGLGNSLGINLRVASYSNVAFRHVAPLREVIQQFATKRAVALQPLPSSFHAEETDSDSIAGLTNGYDRVSLNNGTDPAALTAKVQNCRIAVVGSYHAGVYALAQGVPIVGLYNSDYYRDKFLGLQELFGIGVFPVDLSVPEWSSNLIRQANEAWETAPWSRKDLIEAADRQIECGRTAYNEFRTLVEDRFAHTLNRNMIAPLGAQR